MDVNTKFVISAEDEKFFGKMGSFGIPKFDKIMNGGVPRGFTILALTDPGAGAELFAKQFLSPCEEPENTVYISTNETSDEIMQVYDKYNWLNELQIISIGSEYNERVLGKELQASKYRLEGFNMSDIQRLSQTRFVDDETEDFLTEMANSIIERGPFFRCAIENLDFFFQRYEKSRVISMSRMMQAHTQMAKGILLLCVSTDSLDSSIEQEMSSIADMVLTFGVHMIGSEFETRMIVRKFRNAPENLSVMSYRVTPEEGITPETVQRIA